MATIIQSVDRAARVLEYVSEHPRVLATEVAEHFSLTAPTAHHLLNTLVQVELLRKNSERQYELGAMSERIAVRAVEQMRPAPALRVALKEFAQRTGESCYLTAWRGDQIAVIAAVEGKQSVRVEGLVVGYAEHIHARVGARVILAHATATARDWALAGYNYSQRTPNTVQNRAELERALQLIRDRGYDLDFEQLQEGVASLAAPITIAGEVHAALSLTAPLERFRSNEERYLTAIRECARLAEAYAEHAH